MPLATQLFTPLSFHATTHAKKIAAESSASSSPGHSFSDTFQAARETVKPVQQEPKASRPTTDAKSSSKSDVSGSSGDDAHSASTADGAAAASDHVAEAPTGVDEEGTPASKPADGEDSDVPASPNLVTQLALTSATLGQMPVPIKLTVSLAAKGSGSSASALSEQTAETVSVSRPSPGPKLSRSAKSLKKSADSGKNSEPVSSASDSVSDPALGDASASAGAPAQDLSLSSDVVSPLADTLRTGDGARGSKDVVSAERDTTAPSAASVAPSVSSDAAAALASATVESVAPKPSIATLESPATSSRSDVASSSVNLTPTAALSAHSSHAESASAAQNSPRTEDSQTYDQIVLGLRTKLDAQNGKAEIHLNPPNLGALHVSIHLTNGSLTAQFNSPSEVVRDLLKGNMDKLKTVLQNQGIAVDKLAVTATANNAQASPDRDPQSGSAPHDGRSAGYSQQDASHQKGSSKDPHAQSFARAWRNAVTDAAPVDLVA